MNLDKPTVQNPYTPPQTTLNPPPLPTQAKFFVVSEKKLWIMYVLTFSLYGVYWFYQHWKKWKEATGDNIMPIPRAIFSIFFTHTLFQKIYDSAKQADSSVAQMSSLQMPATMVVLGALLTNFIDKLSGDSMSIIWLLATVIIFIAMGWGTVQAQRLANIACHDPSG